MEEIFTAESAENAEVCNIAEYAVLPLVLNSASL